MSPNPTIGASEVPLTPRTAGAQQRTSPSGGQNGNSNTNNIGSGYQRNLTPSYNFGFGFSPSFQFNSPRNLLSGLSPHRFFQASNNLTKATVGAKRDEKNVFNTSTPSRTSSKFLDSLSSANNTKNDSGEDSSTNSHDTEESAIWSVNEAESQNLTSLTISYDQTPIKVANKENENTHQRNFSGDFLTPNKLFLHRQDHSVATKKRRLSVEASPNTSIASRLETIASPPRSSKIFNRRRSSSNSSLSSKNSEDKVWNDALDDILISSYMKFKAFKKNTTSESYFVKNVSQNKVLSRMLLNKSGVLRTPKQIASRLFKITKSTNEARPGTHYLSSQNDLSHSHNILDESPLLNDGLDEIIRTPLEDLIESTSSHIDSVSSAEINAQIDKELDLIFSPNELSASPMLLLKSNRVEITDFQISYNSNRASGTHHFIKSNSGCNRTVELSTNSLLNRLKVSADESELSTKLCPKLVTQYESNDLLVFQAMNHLNLNMVSKNKFDTLDSVVLNANPLDLHNGSISSFMNLLVNGIESDESPLNWSCYTRIFSGSKLLFTSNDSIVGYSNGGNKFEATIPFLKHFWTGFLSLLINGNDDKDILKKLSILQIIHSNREDSKIEMCLIHKFDKLSRLGNSSFQLLKYSGKKEDLNDLAEEDEMFEETQVDHYSQSNDETNSAEDDNETVLVESSPVKAPEFHHRDLKIDIMAAKHSMAMGPASAPIYNPRLVQQMNNGIVKQESINMYPFTQHSQSTNDIPKYIPQPGYGSQMNGNNKAPLPYSTSTPDALSPYSNSFDGSRPMSFGSIQTSSNMATSTSYKGFPIGDQSHFQAPLPPSSVPGHQQIGQAQLRPESQRGSGASQGESQSHMNMSFMASGRQQLMVNVGSGYVPFGSLSQELQERYMGVQKQFELQQQQQIQQALLQQIQMNNLAGTNLQPHQGIAMNTGNIPLSAPASQTSFADPASKSYNTGQKKHSKPIKFGPMLEYDPSKDNAAAAAAAEAASAALAKAKARGESRPGVSVLNIPRDTPVYIYKPPKRKGPS